MQTSISLCFISELNRREACIFTEKTRERRRVRKTKFIRYLCDTQIRRSQHQFGFSQYKIRHPIVKRLPGLFLYTPHQVFIRYTQPARIKGCHPFLCAIFMQQTEETIYQFILPGHLYRNISTRIHPAHFQYQREQHPFDNF